MKKYQYITLRDKKELMHDAANWFCNKWGIPREAYLECMESYLNNKTEYGRRKYAILRLYRSQKN